MTRLERLSIQEPPDDPGRVAPEMVLGAESRYLPRPVKPTATATTASARAQQPADLTTASTADEREPRTPALRGGGSAESRPRHPPAAPLAASLAVLAAAALFGTTGTAQALGPTGTTPLGVGAVRLAIGAVVLALVARLERGEHRPRWRAHAAELLIGGVGVAAYQLALFAGLRRTGVTLGTIVGIGSGPVFAGLLHVARRRGALPRAWIAGTALTVGGVALLAAGGPEGVAADPLGLCLVLGAGLSYAVYAQAAKHAMDAGLDAPHAMAGVFVVGAALMMPLLWREPMAWLGTARGAGMALHLGVLTVGLAYWLYGKGLRILAVPTVVTLTLAEPLTASVLGVAALGERLGAAGWLGAGVVAVGLVVAGRGERASAREEATPRGCAS